MWPQRADRTCISQPDLDSRAPRAHLEDDAEDSPEAEDTLERSRVPLVAGAREAGLVLANDAEAKPSHHALAMYVLKTVALGTFYVAISAALIDYNKFMMSPGRFPFALPLVLVHSVTCVVCAGALYVARPSLFPSLTDPDLKVEISRDMLLKGALPIAVTMCGSLVLSNLAYIWSSVAFLQMMKESNVVLVYLLALAASLETFSWQSARILSLLVVATIITVEGEVRFSWMGFLLQGAAQACECVKVTLQALLLSGSKKKLDPLTYVLVVMPLCVCVLAFTLGILLVCGGGSHVTVPSREDLVRNWQLLVCNGLLAFSLNLVVAAFLKHTSPVAVILVGIIKDAAIVFFNIVFLGEAVSAIQTIGFILQLLLVGLWSAMKTFPGAFEAMSFPSLLGPCGGRESHRVEVNKVASPA